MRNIQSIIDRLGGLAALRSRPIRLEAPGFMRLVIEHVCRGPRGGRRGPRPKKSGPSGPVRRAAEVAGSFFSNFLVS
jgi:hypothetical protein